jgi:hypothetical protein
MRSVKRMILQATEDGHRDGGGFAGLSVASRTGIDRARLHTGPRRRIQIFALVLRQGCDNPPVLDDNRRVTREFIERRIYIEFIAIF